MNWVPILALALAAFLLAAFLFRLPRQGWSLFGATLLFGLTGYALQGNPGEPGAPTVAPKPTVAGNEALIAARRQFFDPELVPSRFVITADAFARQGQYGDAANLLRKAVEDNPKDAEAWLAMGIALVEHAEGNPTAPALYAMDRAQQLAPANPAPAYFYGVAMLQAGQPEQTLIVWQELADKAPAGSPWKAEMEERIKQLKAMMAGAQGMPPAAGGQ